MNNAIFSGIFGISGTVGCTSEQVCERRSKESYGPVESALFEVSLGFWLVGWVGSVFPSHSMECSQHLACSISTNLTRARSLSRRSGCFTAAPTASIQDQGLPTQRTLFAFRWMHICHLDLLVLVIVGVTERF